MVTTESWSQLPDSLFLTTIFYFLWIQMKNVLFIAKRQTHSPPLFSHCKGKTKMTMSSKKFPGLCTIIQKHACPELSSSIRGIRCLMPDIPDIRWGRTTQRTIIRIKVTLLHMTRSTEQSFQVTKSENLKLSWTHNLSERKTNHRIPVCQPGVDTLRRVEVIHIQYIQFNAIQIIYYLRVFI